jgi:hypothetical protein
LLEGGGATGCDIDTKVELRKISEKYHFLIDQWHCINSLEICIKDDIQTKLSDKKKREISDYSNDTDKSLWSKVRKDNSAIQH